MVGAGSFSCVGRERVSQARGRVMVGAGAFSCVGRERVSQAGGD